MTTLATSGAVIHSGTCASVPSGCWITNIVKSRKLVASDYPDLLAMTRIKRIMDRRVPSLVSGSMALASPGVGKTHICVALGIRAVEQGFSVQYFRFDELMTALKSDAGLPPARLKRRKYMSTALLLVDELGFEPMTRQEASLFFRLVTYRYRRGAILITTNKSVRDWTELLAGDEALATAILDRLLHKAHVLNIKGRSYRLRDLEEALKLSNA